MNLSTLFDRSVARSFIARSVIATCLVSGSLPIHAAPVLQTLQGHVRAAVLRGQAKPAGLMSPVQRMHLSIVLPLRNQTQLSSLIGRLYDPSSPDFHKFLTASQFSQQFSPTVQDYQAVVAYAQANGFTVDAAPANRLVVPISGTVAQVEKTFSVRMGLYHHPTENRLFFSPDREPSLSLGVRVAHIAGLDNYSVPEPMYHRANDAQGTTSLAMTGSGPGGSYLASDMRTAYYGGTALTGAGQTVALLEFDGYNKSDVDMTFSSAGQSYNVPIQNVLLDGATGAPTSGNDSEEVLDIVQAIGMAPGLSQVRVYIGGNDVDILNAIASEDVAQEVSISWSWSPDDPATDDAFFEECAAQGQSVFASSGDWGEFDPYFDNFYPAEDAYVTAVGGTDLTTGGGGAWAGESAWDRSGGGVSPDGIALPAWQAGVATSTNGGSNTLRNVPDVSAQADYVNYNCANGSCGGDFGGTSFSAPRWAAFTALVNQQAVAAGNPTVGFLNPALYALGEGTNYAADFHDSTSGNNDTRNNCCGWPYYNAVPGYDLVTGWGSPGGQSLIDDLAPPAAGSFALSASASVVKIAHSGSGQIDIAIDGKSGFSGNVTLAATGLPGGVTAAWGTNPTADATALTLTVDDSVARGSYLITVNGAAGSLTASTSFVLDVQAPGFSLAPAPASLSLYPGTSNSTSILVSDYARFKGSVNLAVTSGLPDGVTASWASDPATGAAELTLTASDSAVPNTDAVVTVTGTSGNLTQTTTVALVISPATFYVNMSPYPSRIAQGGTFTTTVTVKGVSAALATDTIRLSVPELPPGITASLSRSRIQLGQSSTLTLTASSTVPTGAGLAGIEADGTAQGTLNQFALTVTSKSAPSFTLGVAQPAPSLVQGDAVSDTVTIAPQNGFKSSVSLAISPSTPLPGGVTASFAPSTATGSSQIAFTASNTATAGFYPLQITGTSGTLTSVANVYLTVNPPALFTLSASPTSLSVARSSTAAGTIVITPQAGFTGSVHLAILSALPAGVTASFAPATATASSTLAFTADSSAIPGNSAVTIAGTTSGHTVTAILPLTIVSSSATPTSTALSITPAGPLTVGSAYTLTAQVTPSSGTAAPTGGVVFNINGATQTVALNAAGIATYAATAPAAASTLAVSVAYQGAALFQPSTANTLNVSVVGMGTTTALSINPAGGQLAVGSSFTLTAIVTAQSGAATPSGQVVFNIGGASCTGTLNNAGLATCTGTAPASPGTLAVAAAYQGSSAFAPSTSATLNETVADIATNISISISPTTSSLAAGSQYTLTAQVTPASGTAIPTGSVVFSIGATTQTAGLNASGVATYSGTAPAAAGTLSFSAAYQGQGIFSASTSTTLDETIYGTATPAFSLAGASVTIDRGATTGNTTAITILPSGGFTGAVTLTATVASSPAGAHDLPSLSFTASSVRVSGSGAATATLIISTTAATVSSTNVAANVNGSTAEHSNSHWYAPGGAALACLLLFGIPRRRQWQRHLGMLVLLAAVASGAIGCTSNLSMAGTSTDSGTTPGAYLISIQGASGSATAATTVALTVQ
jgi:Pro-kumamolisin, activation domain/Bacterial Ig-like domain (group 3)